MMMNAYKVGSEFLVNTQTANFQLSSTITNLANGGFVVSWYDQSGTLGDASDTSIKAQIFDAGGTKVGAEFLVNSQTFSFQFSPTITGLANGGFVVSWEDNSGTLGDTSSSSIKAQIFNAGGTKVGGEFLVNTQTANSQYDPTITSLANGGFVVSWYDSSGTLGDANTSIKAQIYNAGGTKIGSEFLVNTQTASSQQYPAITGLANGGFVVSWYTFDPAQDGSSGAIKAQIFDAGGTKVGAEFLVNSQTANNQAGATITGLANGGFVVSWHDSSGTLGDASGRSIKAQIFNAGGTKVGGEFLVNSQIANSQQDPAITALPNGGFVVSWQDFSDTLGDAGYANIKAQLFDAGGSKVDTEFLVNTQTVSNQSAPTITRLASGGFVISWTDVSGTLGDASSSSIKAQIFSINSAPVPANDAIVTDEDTPVTFDVRTNDSDADSDPLTVTHINGAAIVAGGAALSMTNGAVALGLDGQLTFTPDANANGPVSFAYTVSDGNGGAADATVNLTINPINDAPMLTGAQLVLPHGTEGVPYTLTVADLLAGFTDVDGDPLSLFELTPSTGAINQVLDQITVYVAPEFHGTETLTYGVTDYQGGLVMTSQQIVFDPVNDAPVITSDGGGDMAAISIAENDTTVTTVTADDVDGDALTYSITGGADAALFGMNETTGALAFLAAPDFEAPADFDGDNIYDVIVSASDGTDSDTQALAVTLTNIVEGVTITGTNGNDALTGTAGDDIINPLLGHDIIDGGAGVDTLNVDYLAVPGMGNFGGLTISATPGGYSGGFYGGNLVNYMQFSNVELLNLTGDDGNSNSNVELSPVVLGGAVTIDARGGIDSLVLDVDAFADDTRFVVDGSPTVDSNRGTFSNFETFELVLNAATSTVVTGAGTDRITTSGNGSYDGGAGVDVWTGNYANATGALSFTDGATATVSNGTTLTGYESVSLTTGIFDDAFAVGSTPGKSYSFNGSAGTDTLLVDHSGIGVSSIVYSNITFSPVSGLSGYFNVNSDGAVRFAGIENLTATLGQNVDLLDLDLRLGNPGGAISVDGGAGADIIQFSLADNSSFVDGIDIAGIGQFTSFEYRSVYVGGGTNSVAMGAADDGIVSGGGVDQIDGGGGNDVWTGNYANFAGPLSGSIIGTSASFSNGTQLANIESFSIIAASGGTSLTTDGRANLTFYGDYAGTDRLTVDSTGTIGGASFAEIYDGRYSGLSVTLPTGNGAYVSADEVDVLTIIGSNDDNRYRVSVLFAPTATLSIDGGLGVDTVQLYGDSAGYAVTAEGQGYRIVDTDANDGTTLSFHVERIEHLQFSDKILDLPAGVTLTGTPGNDTLNGGAGDDVLAGFAGNDLLNGGTGVDTASYADAAKTVKVDLSISGIQNTGGDGKDTLISIENLIGSNFADTLKGNVLDNSLDGGGGNDKLYGGDGVDYLIGGDGNDLVDGGFGADLMEGGLGSDKYYVDNIGDFINESDPLGGTDTVYSSIDVTLGANLEKLTLLTGAGNINGTGNYLNNAIVGNEGDNVLNGTLGKDVLTGGLGADTFVFDVLETTANKDTIKDYVSGTDHIELSVSAFAAIAGYGLGTLDPGELTYGTKALTANDHLIYNQGNGGLYYDVDGVGGAVQIQIAVLTGKPLIDVGDIILV